MKFWQVDAFTREIFRGNPAAVFLFDRRVDDDLLHNLAREMNLSETAFVWPGEEWTIRWFTPNAEVDLCGHATMAAAHILWEERVISEDTITFQSRSGPLTVARRGDLYQLDFPLQPPVESEEMRDTISELLGFPPLYVGFNGHDYMAVVESPERLRLFVPDYAKISRLPGRGLLVTARDPAGPYDYLYRAFFPKLDVPEDPVTGSANTCLAPYWTEQLGQRRLRARQVSARSGELFAEVSGKRVLISGEAVTVFTGGMKLPIGNL